MRCIRSLRFDDLEARKLLTTTHVAVPLALTPLPINGTLAVNLNTASQVENDDGSETTSVSVSGRLGTLGKVTGEWNQSIDEFGNYEGPDTLVLQTHTPKGSITIAFNDNDTGETAKSIGHDTSFYQHAQKLVSSSSAFSKDSEQGSIELMLNTDSDSYKSLVLISVTP